MIAADRGLVLRGHRLRETSKIVSVLGFTSGRLRLVAHGGRGPASRFAACLEPGNEIDLVYSLPPGRELGTLREATLRRAWLGAAGRLEILGVGLAVLELLDRLVPEGAVEVGLAEETVGALAALRGSAGRSAALHIFYAYELRLLGRFGLRPDLGRCAGCGRQPEGGTLLLNVLAGELRCRTCGGAGPGRISVSAEVAGLFAGLADGRWDAVARLASEPRARRAAGLCLHRLLQGHLERYRYPRALELLKKVDSGAVHGPDSAPGDSTSNRA